MTFPDPLKNVHPSWHYTLPEVFREDRPTPPSSYLLERPVVVEGWTSYAETLRPTLHRVKETARV